MINKKLSITYISPGWPLSAYPNGIVTYIQNIVSGFDDDVIANIIAHHVQGVEHESVIDLSQVEGASLIANLIEKVLYRLRSSRTQNMLYQRKWKNVSADIIKAVELQGTRPDLIELEESFGLAKYLTKNTKLPIVTRLHGPWFLHGPIMHLDNKDDYKVRIISEGQAIELSNGITSPSLDVLEKVREFYDLSLADAKVIPNAVPPVNKAQQWQFQADKKQTILMVGRFDLHKGGDLALDAFRIIARRNKDVEFIFVGPDRGVIIEGRKYSFDEYLDSFIPEIDIKNRIQFLGHCDSKKIAELRRTTTVTIMTSRYETFSISLAEALATGSPVVATNVGAIKELVTDNFNGLLAEPESPESIAEKVLKLLDDIDCMKRLSRHAIEDSQQKFSPKIVAKQTLEFYRSILNIK